MFIFAPIKKESTYEGTRQHAAVEKARNFDDEKFK